VVATPSAAEAAKGAQLLVFVAPHQFIPRICDTIKDFVAPGARVGLLRLIERRASALSLHAQAISLVKGFEFVDGDIELVTALITQKLGIECSVLSGANVAEDIAREQFSETTIGVPCALLLARSIAHAPTRLCEPRECQDLASPL
jgi:glycerol-3-phosphate dehydrogenase (NAD+)